MTPAALRDIFIVCVQARGCGLCGRALFDEAVWIAAEVRCLDCGLAHGHPGAPRCHAVWRPEVTRMLRDPESRERTD
jgi:hypothetical protein